MTKIPLVQKNEFSIAGRVVFVGMPIYYSEKTSKRNIVMEVYIGKYRNEVAFDFVNSNMSLLDNIREKDWVLIDFRLKGFSNVQADSKKRWYVNLEGFSCTKQD